MKITTTFVYIFCPKPLKTDNEKRQYEEYCRADKRGSDKEGSLEAVDALALVVPDLLRLRLFLLHRAASFPKLCPFILSVSVFKLYYF